MAFFIPESPRLLVAKGRVEDAKKAINTMAWFNRKTVVWTEEELGWIAENAHEEGKPRANAVELFNSDVPATRGLFTLEISNLPDATNETEFRRMFSVRMASADLENVCVEMAEPASPSKPKKDRKRRLSYKVSFKSEAELVAAIKQLKKSSMDCCATNNFDFAVAASLSDDKKDEDNSPVEDLNQPAIGELHQADEFESDS